MGNGTIDFDDTPSVERYIINLTAVAASQYSNPANDAAQWKMAFEIASQYLFEATRGQLQIGRVDVDLLKNGISHADVILSDDTRDSVALGGFLHRKLDDTSLASLAILRKPAMNYPMQIAHELAHIALGLADEYVGVGIHTVPKCTNHASSGASMMEFSAKKHSIRLTTGTNGAIQPQGATHGNVNQFCFPRNAIQNQIKDYEHGSCLTSPTNLPSAQHYIYYKLKSSWEVILDGFSKMVLPSMSDPVPSNRPPIQWINSIVPMQTSVLVQDVARFEQLGLLPSLKASLLGIAHLHLDNEAQLALVKDSTLIRPLSPILNADLDPLNRRAEILNSILDFENATGEDGRIENLGLDAFQSAGPSAHKRLILVVPGDGQLFAGLENGPGDGPGIRATLEALLPLLQNNLIDLTTVTIGDGPLADELGQLDLNSPRWKHIRVPTYSDKTYEGFHLQSVLSLHYVSDTAGMGIVGIRSGVFPVASARDFLDDPNEFDNPVEALLLHPQAEGVDYPILIEEGTIKATFALNIGKHDEDLSFELKDPLGNLAEVRKLNFNQEVKLLEVDEPLAGRWIVRVRRQVNSEIETRNAVPFQIIAAVENPKIYLKADIQVDGNSIEFTSITIHDSPLDGVDTKVDVYLANEYGKGTAPLTSVVLRNEKIQTNERSDETIEISSGIQSGQTELIPGEYVAIFTSRNVGDAVHANNTKLHPIGFSTPLDQPLIPAFTRVQKRFFSVQ